MRRRTRSLVIMMAVVIAALLVIILPAAAFAAPAMLTDSGTYYFSGPAVYNYPQGVIIGTNAKLAPLDAVNYTISMTVYGVETGQALTTTAGVTTSFVPGPYLGKVVITVAVNNPYVYNGSTTFPFRQAMFVDSTGIVWNKSVRSALQGGTYSSPGEAKNVKVQSTGECFDAFYIGSGSYKLTNWTINMNGNGRSDFSGYGGGIVANGVGTTLTVDKCTINNTGVARFGLIAEGGSNVIVKNSTISTHSGVLPSDYMPSIDTSQMRSVPWMLALSGNVRATNLLGTNTKAAYINSTISSNGWGILSTDGCTNPQLNVINSKIISTGEDGYGTYGIGNAYERFLGTDFDVATQGVAAKGCNLWFGDSNATAVSQLNTQYSLGLTTKEIKSLASKHTVVNSGRWIIMWHGGGGTMDVSGGTLFHSKEAVILDKGQSPIMTIDGSQGAKLLSDNGVIMQVMDDDDPGPQLPPYMYCSGIFQDPDLALSPVHTTFDTTSLGNNAVQMTLSNIKVTGDFLNSMGWTGNAYAGAGYHPANALTGKKNMAITLNNASVTGMITATKAHHVLPLIEAPILYTGTPPNITPYVNTGHELDYRMEGKLINTPSPVINNGGIVTLTNGSKWTMTGTCYLSSLLVDATSSLVPSIGHTITMSVNGTTTALVKGTLYTGLITLTLN